MEGTADPSPSGSRLTLRVKLTLWSIGIFLIIQVTLSTVVLIYHRRWLDRFFNERLDLWAISMAARVSAYPQRVDDEFLAQTTRIALPASFNEPFTLVLYDEHGAVLASTLRPPPPADRAELAETLRDGRPRCFRAEIPGLPVIEGEDPRARFALRPVRLAEGTDGVLLVSRSDVTYETMSGSVTWLLLSTIPVGVLAAGVAAWFVSSMTLAPLEHLRRVAGSLAPERIDVEPEPVANLSRELAALESELKATRLKLLQAFRAQERFISSVSHELKTPISVLLAEGQTLRTDNLPDDARAYVRSVIEEIRRLGRMIESFLMLTQIRGGRGVDTARPCPVNDFVLEAVTDCRKVAAQYGVVMRAALDESDPQLTLWGEPELLRVMVDNLLRNAIRFSPANGRVLIDVRGEAGSAAISVRDFGPGVPGDLIDRIFDRFVQAPDETQRARGYGLGLSIAQGIAELHSGGIRVSNLPDGGCEFRVVLPLIGAAMSHESPNGDGGSNSLTRAADTSAGRG